MTNKFANAKYFDQIRIGQTFKIEDDTFIKTTIVSGGKGHGWGRSITTGKSLPLRADDVCELVPKLYVDDVRQCPEGWDLALNFHQAITMLEATEYAEVSLDHDLGSYYGNKEMTGRDILNWLIMVKIQGGYTPPIVHVHSSNPAGRDTMVPDIAKHFPKE